jgi:hypothetical protein
MTILSNILTVNWDVSPRIITVASGTTEITIQDLLDTCRTIEASSVAMDNDRLIDAAGKEDLGGGTKVGLTATLNNAVLAFEALPGPTWTLCSIIGGNLVAIDVDGVTIDPRTPTSYITVDRTSSASATLQEQTALQFSSYEGRVTIDVGHGVAGTEYPIGTVSNPVSNLTDAVTIAEILEFELIHINHDYTFPNSTSIAGYTLEGSGLQVSTFTFETGCLLAGCKISSAKVTGVLAGVIGMEKCLIDTISSDDITGASGDIFVDNCLLRGTNSLPINFTGVIVLIDCKALPDIGGSPPIFDLRDSNYDIEFRNYSGFLILNNCTQEIDFRLFFNAGGITLSSTVTAGDFIFSGVGTLDNNSTSVTSLDISSLVDQETISQAVWDESIADHLIAGSTGIATAISEFDGFVHINVYTGVSGTAFPIGTEATPVNNLADAKTIVTTYGLTGLDLMSPFTVASGENISGLTLQSKTHTTLTLEDGVIGMYTQYADMAVTGVLGGYSILNSCSMEDISNVYGTIDRGIFGGNVAVSTDNTKNAVFYDCYTGDVSTPPEIDCGGDGAKVSMRGLTGAAKFVNKTGATQKIFIDLYSARVGFDSTITSGTISIRGSGYVYLDDSTGTTFDTTGLMSKDTISEAVWDESIADHLVAGSTGLSVGIAQFDGSVHIDTATGVSGIVFPIGTESSPVNNLADAKLISAANGFDKLHIHGDITIEATDNIDGYELAGSSSTLNSAASTITLISGCSTSASEFEYAVITGVQGGEVRYHDCIVKDISNAHCTYDNVVFWGTVSLASGGWTTNHLTNADDCRSVPDNRLILNWGTESQFKYNHTKWSGDMKITGMAHANAELEINMISGNIEIDPTCTAGTITVRGVGTLVDNSNGTTVNVEGIMNKDATALAVWDEPVGTHLIEDTMGHQMFNQAYDHHVMINTASGTSGTTYPTGAHENPVDNLPDALLIASEYGFTRIMVMGSLTIDGEDITGYTFEAARSLGNSITITSMVNTGHCYFENLTVAGALSGGTRFTTSVLGALTGYDGGSKNCLITGDIVITGDGANYFTDCDTYVVSDSYKEISIGNHLLNIIKCRGSFGINDYTGSAVIAIDLVAGQCRIANTCVSGTIVTSGLTQLTDESGPGCYVIDASLTQTGVATAVWDDDITDNTVSGTAGEALNDTVNNARLIPAVL